MKLKLYRLKKIIENSFRKLHVKVKMHIEQMSDIDEAQMRNICQMAGIEYKSQSEQEAIEELKQYTYQRLDELRDNLEHKQEQLYGEIAELTQKMNAISTSLMIVLKAEEEKLETDKEHQEEERKIQWEKKMQEQWFLRLQEKAREGWGQEKGDS